MVEAQVEAALAENKRQPAKPAVTQMDKGKYTKKVISNPKSPSDTIIYAPALNLTPDKYTPGVAAAKNSQQTLQQITEFPAKCTY